MFAKRQLQSHTMPMGMIAVCVLIAATSSLCEAAQSSAAGSRCVGAFVVPPSASRSGATFIPIQQPQRHANLNSHQLFAKKKKTAAAPTKFQVKLLKHVAGTGSAGDVVQVTPAFFNNKLRPTKSAVVISDDEVAEEQAEKSAQESATNEMATKLQEELVDYVLSIKRKSGPDGKLFAGIGMKAIMEELQAVKPSDLWKGKRAVKVAEILDENGKKMRGDIKKVGMFGATLNLAKSIKVKLDIEIVGE